MKYEGSSTKEYLHAYNMKGKKLRGKKKKRTSKKNVDGRCTSSHENMTFRRRSVAKQKGMVFGFRKTATAVTRPEREIDRKN
jgi:hypothetical protein